MVFLLGLCSCGRKQETMPQAVDVLETVKSAEKKKIITHIDEDKKETVYVTADAYGAPVKSEVEVILKAQGNEPIEDFSRLKEIRNTMGDETFTHEDRHLIFENKGEDIHYKGQSNDPLPVSVKLSYSLDGKDISAEELPGKSGHLKIRFDYQNSTFARKDGYELIIPFMALSFIMLDEEIFYNVKTENARIIEYDGNKIALIAVFPGLKDALKLSSFELSKDIRMEDYAIIEADVDDFKLDYTTTILSNGVFSDLEEDVLNKIDDYAAKADDLSDTDEVKDASSKLLDACISLQDGLTSYTSAVSSLVDSTALLEQGAASLAQGLSQLENSLPDDEASKQMAEMITKQLEELDEMIQVYKETLSSMSASILQLQTLINGNGDDETIPEDQRIEAIDMKPEEREKLNAVIQTLKEDLANLSMTSFDDLNTLISTMSEKLSSLSVLSSAVSALSEGATQLSEGLSQMKEGTETLKNYGCDVNLGAKQLVKAAREFDDGITDFIDESQKELDEFDADTLKDISARIKALKKADKEYMCFSGLLENKEGSSVFVIETAAIK